MNWEMRQHSLLLMLLVGWSWLGCSNKQPPERAGSPGMCDPGDSECNALCQTKFDCGDTQLFECISQQCVAVCKSEKDCVSHPQYDQQAWPGCDDGLCKCRDQKCLVPVCSNESDCKSPKVCKSGVCVIPETDTVKCAVYPDWVIMGSGQKVRFSVVAYRQDGSAAFPGRSAFSWKATSGNIQQESTGTVDFTAQGSDASITATLANANVSCKADVKVVASSGVAAQVVVVDDQSGRLVTDAKVFWNDLVMQPSTVTPGVFTITRLPTTTNNTVSVFHHDYDYVSLVGVDKTHLRIGLRRNPSNLVGGFKGQFQPFPTEGIVVGLAGTSIPDDLTNLNPDGFWGPAETVSVDATGQGIPIPMRVPSGAAVRIGAVSVKERYLAYGSAGVCENPQKTEEGTCGTRAGYGLLGSIPFQSSPELWLAIQEGKVQSSQLLEAAIPFLESFKSEVVRDISFELLPTDRNNSFQLQQAIANDKVFVPQNLSPSVRLSLAHTVQVPLLPEVQGVPMQNAMVLVGSLVAGRGLVPLGFGAGSDAPSACGEACSLDRLVTRVELESREPLQFRYHDDGYLAVHMAPAHGGIENSPYQMVTLATSTTRLATSALVHSSYSILDEGTTTQEAAFLGLLDQGSFQLAKGEFQGINSIKEASLRRVIFISEQGPGNQAKRWLVYFKENSFSVPKVPAEYADRTTATLENRQQANQRARLLLQALRLTENGQTIGINELFDLSSGRVGAAAENLEAFSVYEVP